MDSRVEKLFHAALEIADHKERAEFLRKQCAGDAATHEGVRSLLQALERNPDFLEKAATFPTPASGRTKGNPGSKRYEIEALLGEGGLGSVYLARERYPLSRRVALKLIKSELSSYETLARFESERQILALLTHPGIARVYDAGTMPDGRPFIAMEHIPGLPIHEYCDRKSLGLQKRLELFVKVCEAVAYAHEKGVIHRDLKPGNVLVNDESGQAVPKVIDFGVAKALAPDLQGVGIETEVGRLVGTLEYMSPEQAAGNPIDVDTRSDVYSLGVLLYELLSGLLPYDRKGFRAAPLLEITQRIRSEPLLPMTERLATILASELNQIAEKRRTDARALRSSLRGALDAVVGKAVEKDRNRRYPSVRSLGNDLLRYLDDRPVHARVASVGERITKAIKRNKVLAAAAFFVFLSISIGAVAGWLGLQEALREQKRNREVTSFVEWVLTSVDPIDGGAVDLRVTEMIKNARVVLESRFSQEPRIAITLGTILARTWARLGEYAEARATLQAARARATEAGLEPGDLVEITLRFGEATLLRRTGELELAEALCRETIADAEGSLGSTQDLVLFLKHELGLILSLAGRGGEAESLLRDLLEVATEGLGVDHRQTILIEGALCRVLLSRSKIEEFERRYEGLIARLVKNCGKSHPDTLRTRVMFLDFLEQQGRFLEGEKMGGEIVKDFQEALGEDHPDTLVVQKRLATILDERGKQVEAVGILEKALQLEADRFGMDHPRALSTRSLLANWLVAQGKTRDAVEEYRTILSTIEDSRMGRRPFFYVTMNNLAIALMGLSAYEEAERVLRELIEDQEAVDPEDRLILGARVNLADALTHLGRKAEAAEIYRATMKELDWTKENRAVSIVARINLGRTLRKDGHLAEAEALVRSAYEIHVESVRDDDRLAYEIERELAHLLTQLERHEEASVFWKIVEEKEKGSQNLVGALATRYQQVEKVRLEGEVEEAGVLCEGLWKQAQLLDENEILYLAIKNTRAVLMQANGKMDEAERMFRECYRVLEKEKGDEATSTLSVRNNLADLLKDRKDFESAERHFREIVEITRKTQGESANLGLYLGGYGETLRLQKKLVQAEKELLASEEILRKTFGAAHSNTQDVIKALVLIYQEIGDQEKEKNYRERLSSS